MFKFYISLYRHLQIKQDLKEKILTFCEDEKCGKICLFMPWQFYTDSRIVDMFLAPIAIEEKVGRIFSLYIKSVRLNSHFFFLLVYGHYSQHSFTNRQHEHRSKQNTQNTSLGVQSFKNHNNILHFTRKCIDAVKHIVQPNFSPCNSILPLLLTLKNELGVWTVDMAAVHKDKTN